MVHSTCCSHAHTHLPTYLSAAGSDVNPTKDAASGTSATTSHSQGAGLHAYLLDLPPHHYLSTSLLTYSLIHSLTHSFTYLLTYLLITHTTCFYNRWLSLFMWCVIQYYVYSLAEFLTHWVACLRSSTPACLTRANLICRCRNSLTDTNLLLPKFCDCSLKPYLHTYLPMPYLCHRLYM